MDGGGMHAGHSQGVWSHVGNAGVFPECDVIH